MSSTQGRRRESSRHRGTSRFVPSERVVRAGGALAPVLSLLPAVVAAVLVQSLSPAAQRLPTGSARVDLAAAWLGTETGALLGAHAWLPSPPLGVLQLGLLLRALQAGQAQSVLAAAHGAMLLLAALQVALVWLVLRRLGTSALGAGLGAVVAGIAPAAVAAHSETSAGAIGAAWILVALVLVLRATTVPLAALAGIAAGIGVLSTPATALVVLVVVGAALLIGRSVRRRRTTARTDRRIPAAAAGLAGTLVAVGIIAAVLAGSPSTAAARRFDALAASSGGPGGGAAAFARWLDVDPLSLVLGAAAIGLCLLAGVRGRTVLAVAVVLAVVAVLPLGADPTLPLVLLVPAVGVAVGLTVDVAVAALGHPVFLRSAAGSGWLTGVTAVLVVAVAAWLTGLTGLVPGPSQPLARVERWLRTSVPSGQVVLVGLAAWPDLARSSRATVGWYAGRPGAAGTPSSVSWTRTDYLVTDSSLDPPRSAPAQSAVRRSLPVARFGAGGTEMQVRAVRPSATPSPSVTPPTTDAERRAQAERKRVGRQLAENPRILLDGAGRAQLLAGEVDSRIAIVLAQFVTRHLITVSSFGVAKGDTSGVRTIVLVNAVDGQDVPSDAARTGELLRFLSELRGDFRTASIDATDDGVTTAFSPDPTFVPSP